MKELFLMYKYQLLGVHKMGNKNVYSVGLLGSNEVKMIGLHGIRQALETQQFTNAVLKGNKVIEIYDVYTAIKELHNILGGNPNVQAKLVKTASDGSRRYIKFYNQKGQEITESIYNVLQRFCTFTQNGELSVSGGGMDMIYQTLKMVNGQAHKLNMSDVVNVNYVLYEGK